jgi:hypothetical protein
LGGVKEIEFRFDIEAPERCLVKPIHQVGTSDKDAGERFHLGQYFIDQADFPGVIRNSPVRQEAVDLVNKEDRTIAFGFLEGLGNILLALAHPHRDKVGGALYDERCADLVRVPAAIGALAGSRRSVKTKSAGPGPGQSLGNLSKVYIGIDEARVVGWGKLVGVVVCRRPCGLGP